MRRWAALLKAEKCGKVQAKSRMSVVELKAIIAGFPSKSVLGASRSVCQRILFPPWIAFPLQRFSPWWSPNII
jgi:hypothetical protein